MPFQGFLYIQRLSFQVLLHDSFQKRPLARKIAALAASCSTGTVRCCVPVYVSVGNTLKCSAVVHRILFLSLAFSLCSVVISIRIRGSSYCGSFRSRQLMQTSSRVTSSLPVATHCSVTLRQQRPCGSSPNL